MTSHEPSPLHVETAGSGRTIVFSHGVGSSAGVWDGWVPVLAPSYRVVRWDQPGHGTSAPVDPDRYGPRLAYESLCRVVGDQGAR